MIGERALIRTPFGTRPTVYADYTASGRSLSFIEDAIRDNVLPWYANTHTETSHTGAQTVQFREQARDHISRSVKARENDKVIFCGNGATAAINKLVDLLNLRGPQPEKTLILIGIYEHHSNVLPWREIDADLVVVPLNDHGSLDVQFIERVLEENKHRQRIIGSFSAASNVTGIKTDVEKIADLLKRYQALSFWDYAAAAPYVDIDMKDKDAVFLSPHKFIGGPGTPGVLIVNEAIVERTTPTSPGGGTVDFVSGERHTFSKGLIRREESGTPAIVEAIRAGLVFQLKEQIGAKRIERQENLLTKNAMDRLLMCRSVEVLGSVTADRLPIFSLRFWHREQELHYGFVVALLNDLFGIQARGGCSCAGPYAHNLLNIKDATSRSIEKEVLKGDVSTRPGWVRVSFNYFTDDETFDYILSAIELIAEHGWKLLNRYKQNPATGTWRHTEGGNSLLNLDEISAEAPKTTDVSALASYADEARAILLNPRASCDIESARAPESG